MSSPALPPDNYAGQAWADQQQREEERRVQQEQQAQQQQQAVQQRQELADLRGSASESGRSNARNYFTGRGLNPDEYGSDIDSVINSVLSGIGRDDPNPGSYFQNAGETAYNTASQRNRSQAGRSVDALFAPNFETSRIPFTVDDPYLTAIEGEQRSKADQIIQNMLSRKVITNPGATAARADLDRQAPGARSKLNEIGTSTIAQGQQKLRDIAGRARTTAGGLELGSAFDANTFGSEADQAFNDFIGSLGDSIRAKAPGDLFSTAGLGAIAGAGQGAQNTAFDPNAQFDNGAAPPQEEEENQDSIF